MVKTNASKVCPGNAGKAMIYCPVCNARCYSDDIQEQVHLGKQEHRLKISYDNEVTNLESEEELSYLDILENTMKKAATRLLQIASLTTAAIPTNKSLTDWMFDEILRLTIAINISRESGIKIRRKTDCYHRSFYHVSYCCCCM